MAAYRWIGDQREFEELVDELAKASVYAIDTEFHRERSYYPRLALVQLASEEGLAVVDPFVVDISPLSKALDGDGLAVAHAAGQDLEILERLCGRSPRHLFDTQMASGFLGFATPSLQALVYRMLGKRLAKGDRLSDWTRRPLSEAQREYAVLDVAHLLELRAALTRELDAIGRLGWAEEECELLRARQRPPQVPEEAWWRMKDARQLRGKSRGVAQEVTAWRERLAAYQDRLPRLVLPDLALAAIVHRPPTTLEELRHIRGLEGRPPERGEAAGILEAVRAGLALEESELRLPRTALFDKSMRSSVALSAAWVGQLAEELRIDPSLLGTRADIQAFLRHEPGARMANGWRLDLVGDPLMRLASGAAALAVEGDGLVLEERYVPRWSALGP